MFLELFLLAKKLKFLTKGGIHCIVHSADNVATQKRKSVDAPFFDRHRRHAERVEHLTNKGAVYVYEFLSKSWMFLEMFLFVKKIKFLTKGGIHCIFRSSLEMRGDSLVELTEHDSSTLNSAAGIIVHTVVFVVFVLFLFCFVFILSLELCRCSSDIFLSSRRRTG